MLADAAGTSSISAWSIVIPAVLPAVVGLIALVVNNRGNNAQNRRQAADSSVERIDKVAARQEDEINRLTTDREYWRNRALKAEAERDEQRDLADHLADELAIERHP